MHATNLVPLFFGFFYSWERERSQSKIFVSLPNLNKVTRDHSFALVQKLRNIDRTEFCILKSENSLSVTYIEV